MKALNNAMKRKMRRGKARRGRSGKGKGTLGSINSAGKSGNYNRRSRAKRDRGVNKFTNTNIAGANAGAGGNDSTSEDDVSARTDIKQYEYVEERDADISESEISEVMKAVTHRSVRTRA